MHPHSNNRSLYYIGYATNVTNLPARWRGCRGRSSSARRCLQTGTGCPAHWLSRTFRLPEQPVAVGVAEYYKVKCGTTEKFGPTACLEQASMGTHTIRRIHTVHTLAERFRLTTVVEVVVTVFPSKVHKERLVASTFKNNAPPLLLQVPAEMQLPRPLIWLPRNTVFSAEYSESGK